MKLIKVDGALYDVHSEFYDPLKATSNKNAIYIKNFFISDFVIEQKDWCEVMSYNPSYFKNVSLPVECVSWYEAVEYCNKKSALDGYKPCYSCVNGEFYCDFEANGYRLPTEAEWEFAAKGGKQSRGFMYAGSNNVNEVAWYAKNSHRTTHAKGEKKPNELGIYDMSGNVFEWCWDWYSKYDIDYNEYPAGAVKGKERIIRGNCWLNGITTIYLNRRVKRLPSHRNHHLGFRIVRNCDN